MYTGYKDIPDFYNTVRLSLNNVSETTLSDEMIDNRLNAPSAERDMKLQVSDWETLEDDFQTDFEDTVILQTAINCYDVYSSSTQANIKKQSNPNLTLEFDSKSSKKGESLLDKLRQQLNRILDRLAQNTDTNTPNLFSTSLYVTKGTPTPKIWGEY